MLERALWKNSEAEREVERGEREVKGWYLRSLGVDDVEGEKIALGREDKGKGQVAAGSEGAQDPEDGTGFWVRDEGMDEIRRAVKDA